MINFKEELLRYEPILEIDDIEESIHQNELQDIIDILQYVSKKKSPHSYDVSEQQMKLEDGNGK